MEPYCSGFDRNKDVAACRCRPNPIRMVSVSTTLSASEFTENAGITQSATNTKQSFRHRLFAPRTVVLDPAATLDTPDWLLFCTGIRAVDHAVENYCNARAQPGDRGAVAAGAEAARPRAAGHQARPGDLAPRLEAQIGMWQAIAPSRLRRADRRQPRHRLRAGRHLRRRPRPHLLRDAAAVLQWNAAVNAERQKALSEAMGAPGRPASELVRELVAGLDQPVTLRGVGIKRENLDEIARRALGYQPVQAQPAPDQDGARTSRRSSSSPGERRRSRHAQPPVRAASVSGALRCRLRHK